MNLHSAIDQSQERPAGYVLLGFEDKYLYKGACRNLKERLKDHAAGRCSRTKNMRPLRLVHHECCPTYNNALKREKFFKSGQGRKWINLHVKSKE